MSRTIRNNTIDNRDGAKGRRGRKSQNRDIALRVVRRRDPDLRRMGRALIALALSEAEAAAAAKNHANDITRATEPSADKESARGV